MLGLSIGTFTQLHVVISLVGIVTGAVVLAAMIGGRLSGGWTEAFLATTVLTSVTGFMFPFTGFLPSHAFGVISLVLLAGALFALYGRHLAAPWRAVYVVTALIALYLNVVVAVVQSFSKLSVLQPIPGAMPVVQGVVLVAFVALGVLAVRRFRPA